MFASVSLVPPHSPCAQTNDFPLKKTLFGMNVNLLKNDPDWRWALLSTGICITSTMGAWLIFRFFPVSLAEFTHVALLIACRSNYGSRKKSGSA